MIFKWLGHACFLITLANGKKIVTDPFDNPDVRYPKPDVAADFVTVSHAHSDHDAVGVIGGQPAAIQGEGRKIYENIAFTGIPSFHDEAGGSKRGVNTIFIIEAEDLRVCHLGDLGHLPDKDLLRRIGAVDVLMIPVGGFYTIGPDEAEEVVRQLQPRYVLPMHYKTDLLNFPVQPADSFLKHYPSYLTKSSLEVTARNLPDSMQVVLLTLN